MGRSRYVIRLLFGAALMVACLSVAAALDVKEPRALSLATLDLSVIGNGPKSGSQSGSVEVMGGADGTLSVCSASESAARSRCMSSCRQNETPSYTPGVCGVGGKCACMLMDSELPID